MPTKIEAICGPEERKHYDRLLKDLQEKSSELQLHFHALEPFVSKERFITNATPSAGPEIEAASDEPPSRLRLQDVVRTVAAKPVLPKTAEPLDISILVEPDKDTQAPVSQVKLESMLELKQETKQTLPITEKIKTPLEEYLDRVGWVQCRKCGKVHYMTFGVFTKMNVMYCQQCGFHMHFEAFSKKIAAEAPPR